MDLIEEDSTEGYDAMQKIIEEADLIILNSLPRKSKAKYLTAYERFKHWRREKKIASKDLTEEVMLVYLEQLVEIDQLKPPTVWSKFSMLKTTLLAYENVNVKPWEKVTAFMKKLAKGYCPKKSRIFSADDVTNFCTRAPDETYLAEKVLLILGMAGGLRREEIYNIRIDDIAEEGNTLLFSIPKTKHGNPESFVVMGELRSIIQRYRALCPTTTESKKFLINYQKGRCNGQVIGINKIGGTPRKIASFLGKSEANLYTGHSFRRTSATLLVDAGADITELKRHGGWKSSAVAEGYLGDSISNGSVTTLASLGRQSEHPSQCSALLRPFSPNLGSMPPLPSQCEKHPFGLSYRNILIK